MFVVKEEGKVLELLQTVLVKLDGDTKQKRFSITMTDWKILICQKGKESQSREDRQEQLLAVDSQYPGLIKNLPCLTNRAPGLLPGATKCSTCFDVQTTRHTHLAAHWL